MNTLYILISIVPIICIGLAALTIVKVRSSRLSYQPYERPTLNKADTGAAPRIKEKDPHEGKIVVAKPLNRIQRRLLKKDAKKYYKAKGFPDDKANAIAVATVKSVIVDPSVAHKRHIGVFL